MWGRDFADIMENYRNIAGMFINGEDMPRADNRITLNKTMKDAFGLPVANIHFDEHENDTAMRKHAQGQAKKVYDAVGAKRMISTRLSLGSLFMCTARLCLVLRVGVCVVL